MPLLIIIAGILLLFVLIIVVKLDTFISFLIVCIAVGIFQGMPLDSVVQSIQKGIGDTLGFLVMIIGLGAMLGKLVADSGAAQRITSKLVNAFGLKYIQWAVVLAGFIVGIPMFYSVGFVILIPLVFTVAASTGLPLIYVGLPMLTSLSVTHGFLPPHPAPTAIVGMFGADTGKTLLYGIVIAVPAIILAGPLFARTIKNIEATPLKEFYNPVILKDNEMPSMAISTFTALIPVILIMISTVLMNFIPENGTLYLIVGFIGNPVIAMLISVLVAIYTLGLYQGKKMGELMQSISNSVSSITMVLLIIAGAGALKQILVDSGVSDYIGELLKGTDVSPLFLGWMIAAIIRVCVGSATVAGLTAAGIALPLVSGTSVNPELMVLAVGSGSLMLSHVNDGGFWMFKEYFNLSIKETLSTWTVMETIVGIIGIGGVLLLDTILT
ncbi:gluconate:H+ symporter [Ulvibacterium sp.]|uniref:gluconate:H+ symporter n=1 Tax=Ulvibacterium sp. TaxID=2665914 RepID=UPI003BAB1B97